LKERNTSERRAITLLTVLVGLVLIVVANLASCYSHYICGSSYIAADYFPLSVAFPFFFLLGGANLAVHFLGRAVGRKTWGFNSRQIIVIVIMLLIGSTVPTYGLIGAIVPAMTGLVWFSSAETPWLTTLLPHVNQHLMPSSIEAIRSFYLGSSSGIPWGDWIVPIIAWSGFLFAFYIFCLALVSIFTRQWMDEERLRFPIAQMAVEIAKPASEGSRVPALFTNKLFWIGVLVPTITVGTEIIHFYYPGFSPLKLNKSIETVIGGPHIYVRVIWVIVGLTFLAQREIQFSIWFFHYLMIAQLVILAKLGISGRLIAYHSKSPIAGWQSFGALVVYVCVTLFLARRLLAKVFLKAFGKKVDLDDSDQFLSSRVAVFAFLFSLAYMAVWLHWAGMDWKIEIVFIPLMLLIFIGITRAVLESGLIWLRGPTIAQVPTAYLLGAKHLSVGSLGAMSYAFGIHSDIKAFLMPAAAHSAYMGRQKRIPMRPLVIIIGLSLIVAILVSFTYTLHLGYSQGMANARGWIFAGAGRQPWLLMEKFMNVKEGAPAFGPDRAAWTCVLIGVAAASLLYLLRFRLPWWPLHPIGLAFAFILPIQITAMSVFVAWLAKTVILKLGGVKLYDKAKSFFMGLVFGHVMAAGIALIIDFASYPARPGHFIYGW